MSTIFFFGSITLLIIGTALLLWTLFGKLQLPRWEQAVILVFLVLTLAGLVIFLLTFLLPTRPVVVG